MVCACSRVLSSAASALTLRDEGLANKKTVINLRVDNGKGALLQSVFDFKSS
jgi:hypothetical protein